MYDLTFERDPLERADQGPDWGEEIPLAGELLPSHPDPNWQPTLQEGLALIAFESTWQLTGDLFAAFEAGCKAFNGRRQEPVSQMAFKGTDLERQRRSVNAV